MRLVRPLLVQLETGASVGAMRMRGGKKQCNCQLQFLGFEFYLNAKSSLTLLYPAVAISSLSKNNILEHERLRYLIFSDTSGHLPGQKREAIKAKNAKSGQPNATPH